MNRVWGKPRGSKSRTLLGLRVTVAGKLALVEKSLARLPSTSERVDVPKARRA